MTDQPVWTCADCGTELGNRQPQYATWHMGTCGVCGRRMAVTEPRDFGYLRPSWRGMFPKRESFLSQETSTNPVGATTKNVGQSTCETPRNPASTKDEGTP